MEFYKNISPVFEGVRKTFPTPTISPVERMIGKMAFRNERTLYKRKCDHSGRDIISVYPAESPYTVYKADVWWGSDWSAYDFGAQVDFDRPFFDQFFDLMEHTPLLALYAVDVENSDYNNACANLKDSYLCFNVDYLERCYYVGGAMRSSDCIDCTVMDRCEWCYESFNITECQNCWYCTDCNTSSDLFFCHACEGCQDCLLCFNQYRKRHCILNQQYSPEEYEKKKKEILSSDMDAVRTRFESEKLKYPHRYLHGLKNENVTGSYMYMSKNAYNCHQSIALEDCKNCVYCFEAKNCQDFVIYGNGSNYIYQCIATGTGISNTSFCIGTWKNTRDSLYCYHTVNGCHDCFGCVSLNKGSYSILNTAY